MNWPLLILVFVICQAFYWLGWFRGRQNERQLARERERELASIIVQAERRGVPQIRRGIEKNAGDLSATGVETKRAADEARPSIGPNIASVGPSTSQEQPYDG